jgi:hypothetical protein
MAWSIGGTRIYVQNSNGNSGQIIARLQPVNGGTTLHFFGYESLIRSISAIIVGDANLGALFAMSQDSGTTYEFVGPEGTLGSYYVKSFSFSRTNSTCQTIDTLQAETAPVYDIELELQRED